MQTSRTLVTAYCVIVSFLFADRMAKAQESGPPAPLSLEEVLKLHKAGFSDDVIVTRIRKNAKAFSLSTDELVDLKKAGLSDLTVRFLLDPSQPYTPPAPAPPHGDSAPAPAPTLLKPPRKFPPDDNAAQVPPEPGLYRFVDGKPARLEIKLLLAAASGGLGKVVKSKGLAYLAGNNAPARTNEITPCFYFRPPEGKGPEDLVLVELDRKGGRREIEIGPKLTKLELKSDAIRSYESVEVGAQLFRLTTAKLTPGEYLFFQVGSADPAKGSAGKGFDFGIEGAKSGKGKKAKKKK